MKEATEVASFSIEAAKSYAGRTVTAGSAPLSAVSSRFMMPPSFRLEVGAGLRHPLRGCAEEGGPVRVLTGMVRDGGES